MTTAVAEVCVPELWIDRDEHCLEIYHLYEVRGRSWIYAATVHEDQLHVALRASKAAARDVVAEVEAWGSFKIGDIEE